MLKIKDLEQKYNVTIIKQANKYKLDNRKFTNLRDVKEYLDIKVINTLPDQVKYRDYLKFKKIIVNGKEININDCQFLNDLYGFINWYLIKGHHSILSVTVSENWLLLNPNLYDNRQGTKMKEYQFLPRYGDRGNAKQAIKRKEIKVLNLEDIRSIFVYGVSNNQKYDITCLYRKEVKKDPLVLAPIKHQDSISKLNNHIAFHSDKSTTLYDQGIGYSLQLTDNKVYLIVDDQKCRSHIGQYDFISIPSIEYHYRNTGNVINDKDKKMTLGKIKTYLNNKQYSMLYEYLASSQYIENYKKVVVDNEIVELKVSYVNGAYATYNLVRLDKTYLRITLLPNCNEIVKQFLDIYYHDCSTLITGYQVDNFKLEEELNNLELIKSQKINYITQKFITLRQDLKKSFKDNVTVNNESLEKLLHDYKIQKSQLVGNEKRQIITAYNELNMTFESIKGKIRKLNSQINNLENTLSNLELTDYKQAIKKLVSSAMNSDNNKRLNSLLGNEYQDTKKVYSVNSKIQVTNKEKEKAKISLKQLTKMTQKFISKLDNNSLVIDDKNYGFNYYIERINRNDQDNPFIEKINIPKSRLNPKILNHFDNFILDLCLSNIDRLNSLPYIYPNKDISSWLKLNNRYLSKYGIEIMEK